MGISEKVYTRGDSIVFPSRLTDGSWSPLDFTGNAFENPKSTLFSRGKRTRCFITQDSGLYVTADQREAIKNGGLAVKSALCLDGIRRRAVIRTKELENNRVFSWFWGRYESFSQKLLSGIENSHSILSPKRVWNLSIVSALLVGMVSMSLIYRYLGQSADAEIEKNSTGDKVIERQLATSKVLGESIVKKNQDGEEEIEDFAGRELSTETELDTSFIASFISENESEDVKKNDLEDEIRKMVKGYPIEKMVSQIAKQDRVVAAFLIGIAKKESNWGRRVPVLNGQDCFNYWGYRLQRERMGSGGHTCFDSPKDAVETVAKRIKWLVEEADRNTPSEMVIWKCGSACAKDNRDSVNKWIGDVALYFEKLNK